MDIVDTDVHDNVHDNVHNDTRKDSIKSKEIIKRYYGQSYKNFYSK